MNTKEIVRLSQRLDSLNESLAKYQSARTALNFSGHQAELSASIGGVRLQVSEMDRYYQSSVKRGYEMIHLGAIKVFENKIDECNSEIVNVKRQIIDLAVEGK